MILKKILPAYRDERGSISDIFYQVETQHAAIIESTQAGVIRGNHYHNYHAACVRGEREASLLVAASGSEPAAAIRDGW